MASLDILVAFTRICIGTSHGAAGIEFAELQIQQ